MLRHGLGLEKEILELFSAIDWDEDLAFHDVNRPWPVGRAG